MISTLLREAYRKYTRSFKSQLVVTSYLSYDGVGTVPIYKVLPCWGWAKVQCCYDSVHVIQLSHTPTFLFSSCASSPFPDDGNLLTSCLDMQSVRTVEHSIFNDEI